MQKKRTATQLTKMVNKHSFSVGVGDNAHAPLKAVEIHGDRSQAQRESALAAFRSGQVSLSQVYV